MTNEKYQFDYLVIGSGLAGLFFALQVAEHGTVAIVTKKEKRDSSTNLAQGGIACVTNDTDNLNLHIADTLEAGAGLCNRQAVEIMVREGSKCIQELISIGADFSKNTEGIFELGREGGHSKNRIVHAKDSTGKEIEEKLLEAVAKQKNISIFENYFVIDLIIEKKETTSSFENICTGAWLIDNHEKIKPFKSKITLIATGGCGQLFQHTTNPSIATGDGIALAFSAGAKIRDLEFIQFHPTILHHPLSNSFLISEALRGAGAVIVNKEGQDFTKNINPKGSLASRDIVARAIESEMKNTNEPCVYLDATKVSKKKLIHDFPNIYNRCLSIGLDISKELIPVTPAAHYMCGGVSVDLNSRTNIANLYACGEVSTTGAHGANRLASNSLLEALVFSKRAAIHSLSILNQIPSSHEYALNERFIPKSLSTLEEHILNRTKQILKKTMTNYVGIVRSNNGLYKAKKIVEQLEKELNLQFPLDQICYKLGELRNMLLVSKQIILFSMERGKNIGLYFNTDLEGLKNRPIEKYSPLSSKQGSNNILGRI